MHLGHNRSVADIVRAAIQEDADAIAVSSYQGGHNEYFRYMVDMLREHGADAHPRGRRRRRHHCAGRNRGLEAYGVEKIYTPEDGRQLGLDGMIADVFARVGRRTHADADLAHARGARSRRHRARHLAARRRAGDDARRPAPTICGGC